MATADRFTTTVEHIIGRKVRAFASVIDPEKGVAMEIFVVEPSA